MRLNKFPLTVNAHFSIRLRIGEMCYLPANCFQMQLFQIIAENRLEITTGMSLIVLPILMRHVNEQIYMILLQLQTLSNALNGFHNDNVLPSCYNAICVYVGILMHIFVQ